MPMFMDFHKFTHITIDDVKNAHIADASVQSKYGVVYHQFWVNEEAGSVFCLMEGPSREACEAVHREAHGNIACAMVEVETGFYQMFMGESHRIDHGHVQHPDGSVDLGYRHILVVSVRGITVARHSAQYHVMRTPHKARRWVQQAMASFGGREVKWSADDSLIGVFTDANDAVRCATQIQHALQQAEETEADITFKIGISAGQPVTREGEFFTDAIRLAYRLCNIARERQILVSSLVKDLCDDTTLAASPDLRSLDSPEEEFVSCLLTITEKKLSDEQFTIENLSRDIGVSRPQLYRKITSLTGRSPNDLIRDLRMNMAPNLLRRKSGNISEIALEVGYHNPSYFAKCFSEKYGCTPSEFVETLKV